MANERLAQAIRRLDRALARVEAASVRKAAQPDPALEQLQRRHERLRVRAKDAIGALDRLIGS